MEPIASRVLTRYASTQDILSQAQKSLLKYRAWSRGFPAALSAARSSSKDLPDGWVWQDELVSFWRPFDAIQRQLFKLLDALEAQDRAAWAKLKPFFDPPQEAQIEAATDESGFFDRNGETQIAYKEANLRRWYREFTRWVVQALAQLA